MVAVALGVGVLLGYTVSQRASPGRPQTTVISGEALAPLRRKSATPHSALTPQSRPAPVLKSGAKGSFAALERRLGSHDTITVAVEPIGRGRMETLGDDFGMQGMSTTKALILAALLRDRHGVTGLTPAERDEADAAITQSDNDAILALFSVLERDRGGLIDASTYATSLLREAGDPITTVATAPPPPLYVTTFGQTNWTPAASVKFFRALALGCLLPPADTGFVIGLMRRIEPSESWGLGSAGFSSVAFKGGWGPEPDGGYGVRQDGIIGEGDRRVVVAIAVDPAPTFATGTAILSSVSRWLRAELRLEPRPVSPCPN